MIRQVRKHFSDLFIHSLIKLLLITDFVAGGVLETTEIEQK